MKERHGCKRESQKCKQWENILKKEIDKRKVNHFRPNENRDGNTSARRKKRLGANKNKKKKDLDLRMNVEKNNIRKIVTKEIK